MDGSGAFNTPPDTPLAYTLVKLVLVSNARADAVLDQTTTNGIGHYQFQYTRPRNPDAALGLVIENGTVSSATFKVGSNPNLDFGLAPLVSPATTSGTASRTATETATETTAALGTTQSQTDTATATASETATTTVSKTPSTTKSATTSTPKPGEMPFWLYGGEVYNWPAGLDVDINNNAYFAFDTGSPSITIAGTAIDKNPRDGGLGTLVVKIDGTTRNASWGLKCGYSE
jgi:hypothetical protein